MFWFNDNCTSMYIMDNDSIAKRVFSIKDAKILICCITHNYAEF